MEKRFEQWAKVEIVWVDSLHTAGWKYGDQREPVEDKEQLSHRSVGYLYHRGKLSTSIVQSTKKTPHPDRDEAVADMHLEIPNCAILSIKQLK